MSELFKVVLSLSFSGSLLILMLFFCKSLFKHRISKRWQYYIWLVVVARLLLPFTPEVSPVGTLFMEVDQAIIQTDTSPISGQNTVSATQPGNDAAMGKDKIGQTETAPATDTLRLQKAVSALFQNLWLIWLVVALVFFIRKITIYQGFVRYIKAGSKEVSDIALLDRLALLGKQVGVKKPVELFTNDLISSPLLLGFFRPCIVLPTANLPDSDFKYTLLHELTHFKRLDMFYKWLVQITICLHWFNPFAYIMGREVNRACELACDEAVIRELSPKEQRIYGDTLLNAIRAEGDYKDSLASVTLTEGKELLKERLNAIMVFKKKSVLAISTSILLTFIFSSGASALGAYAATPSTNPVNLNSTSNPSNQAVWDLGQVTRWNISVGSENVIVKRGGTSFQIEVTPESKSSYLLEDYMHIITDDFQEREISLQQKEGLGEGAVYASTIIVTVPTHTKDVLNTIITTSGNIRIDNSHADKILAESGTGTITITNSFATDYIIAESLAGTVTLINTTSDGEIYVQDKNTAGVDSNGNSHLSQSGYSKDEFSKLLKVAESYADVVAKKENIGVPCYVGELFDLEVVKGTITFTFDLANSKYTTLVVNVNSDGKVTGFDYWNSPD